MKAASADLIALLANTNQYAIWETYEFTFADGSTVTWTNGDVATASQLGQVVNLDAIANAGVSSAVGVTLSGLDPTVVYEITLINGLYEAWSRVFPGNGWGNDFRITTSGGTVAYGDLITYTTPAAARGAFPGTTITGFSSYTFWLFDNASTANNAGGLSIVVTPQ